jgi:hypothetical protein
MREHDVLRLRFRQVRCLALTVFFNSVPRFKLLAGGHSLNEFALRCFITCALQIMGIQLYPKVVLTMVLFCVRAVAFNGRSAWPTTCRGANKEAFPLWSRGKRAELVFARRVERNGQTKMERFYSS